jgi:hypothetical protein
MILPCPILPAAGGFSGTASPPFLTTLSSSAPAFSSILLPPLTQLPTLLGPMFFRFSIPQFAFLVHYPSLHLPLTHQAVPPLIVK